MHDEISFSGGRTSAYLVHLLHHKAGVTFMDTGAEHPGTYEFIRQIHNQWQIPIVCLRMIANEKMGDGVSYQITDINNIGPDLKPWKEMLRKFGTPYLSGAFCTERMKTIPFTKYMTSLYGRRGYNTWLGIRYDEPRRLWGKDVSQGLNTLGYDDDMQSDLFKEMIALAREDNEAVRLAIMSDWRFMSTKVRKTVIAELMIKGLENKVKARLYYLAEISDFTKQDILDWWKKQPFDLQIEEHLGNCMFCIKKSLGKVALAVRDEPEFAAEFWDTINSDDVRVVPSREGNHLEMYRSKHTLHGVIASFSDLSRDELAGSLRSMRRYDSNSCSESCEMNSTDE